MRAQRPPRHRLSWGTNYGAVGGDTKGAPGTYPSYGDDKRLVGFPYQSYSVFTVLGKHTNKTVLTQWITFRPGWTGTKQITIG